MHLNASFSTLSLHKDIHNASVYSFTYCAKISISTAGSERFRGIYVVEKCLDIRRVRDQERQEMRRVGECHVPDTDAHRGVSRKAIAYVGL